MKKAQYQARLIHRDFFSCPDLTDLPWWGQLLFGGMIVFADDAGVIRADPEYLRSLVLVCREPRGRPRLAALRYVLSTLEVRGMLSACILEGISHYRITNFAKFQPDQKASRARGIELNRIELKRIEENRREDPLAPMGGNGVSQGEIIPNLPPSAKSPDPTQLDQEIMARWNLLAEKHRLGKIQGMSVIRRKKLEARLLEHPDLWEILERELPLLGSFASGGAWLTFDWLLSPSNFQKLLEGNYRARESEAPPDKIGAAVRRAMGRLAEKEAKKNGMDN